MTDHADHTPKRRRLRSVPGPDQAPRIDLRDCRKVPGTTNLFLHPVDVPGRGTGYQIVQVTTPKKAAAVGGEDGDSPRQLRATDALMGGAVWVPLATVNVSRSDQLDQPTRIVHASYSGVIVTPSGEAEYAAAGRDFWDSRADWLAQAGAVAAPPHAIVKSGGFGQAVDYTHHQAEAPTIRTAYDSSGLVRLPDGTLAYTEPGGLILPTGQRDASRFTQWPDTQADHLDGTRFGHPATLPTPTDGNYAWVAQLHQLAAVDAGPAAVAAVAAIIGSWVLAPIAQAIPEGCPAVGLFGASGSMKTTLAHVALYSDYELPDGAAHRPTIDLRERAHRIMGPQQACHHLAGAVVLLDDGLRPHSGPAQRAGFASTVSELCSHAETGRGAALAKWNHGDGGHARQWYPRGGMIFTSEIVPETMLDSTLARLVLVRMTPGLVDVDQLARIQSPEGRAGLRAVRPDLIGYLLTHHERIAELIPERRDAYQDAAGHGRIAAKYGALDVACQLYSDYLHARGALTATERDQVYAKLRAGLEHACRAQGAMMRGAAMSAASGSVVDDFARALLRALRDRRAAVTSPDRHPADGGMMPPDLDRLPEGVTPDACGWRYQPNPTGEHDRAGLWLTDARVFASLSPTHPGEDGCWVRVLRREWPALVREAAEAAIREGFSLTDPTPAGILTMLREHGIARTPAANRTHPAADISASRQADGRSAATAKVHEIDLAQLLWREDDDADPTPADPSAAPPAPEPIAAVDEPRARPRRAPPADSAPAIVRRACADLAACDAAATVAIDGTDVVATHPDVRLLEVWASAYTAQGWAAVVSDDPPTLRLSPPTDSERAADASAAPPQALADGTTPPPPAAAENASHVDAAGDQEADRAIITRRRVLAPTSRVILWHDPATGTTTGPAVTHPKGGRVGDLLAMIPADPARYEVVMLGPLPPAAKDLAAWAGDHPDGFEPDRQKPHHIGADPILRFIRRDGAHVTIRRATVWHPALGDVDHPGPRVCADAYQLAESALALAGFETEHRRAYLWSTPAATGGHLWQASLPFGAELPVLDADTRSVFQDDPGGRIEHYPLTGDRGGLVILDARIAYAAHARHLGRGPVTHDESAAWPDQESGPRQPGRMRVRATVPDDWRHVGLLPTHRGRDGWEYPNEPGRVFETTCSVAEATLARDQGWRVDVLERWLLTPDDSSGRWVRMLRAAIGPKLSEASRRAGADPEARRLAGRMLRSVLVMGVGGWRRGDRIRRRVLPLSDELPDTPHTRRAWREGDSWVWDEPETTPRQGWEIGRHPELWSGVTSRLRARMLVGHRGDGCGALNLAADTLLAIRADALYLTHAPDGWVDDGAYGRLRVKGRIAGPVDYPADAAGRFAASSATWRLRDQATALVDAERGEG